MRTAVVLLIALVLGALAAVFTVGLSAVTAPSPASSTSTRSTP